jgi:DNA-binding protein H-NS
MVLLHIEGENLMSEISKKLKAIVEQEAKLQAQKDSVRREAIETANNLIAVFGLKPSELNFSGKVAPAPVKKEKEKKPRAKVAPKYRLESGETWTGRGRMPVAFAKALEAQPGLTIDASLINKPAEPAPAA